MTATKLFNSWSNIPRIGWFPRRNLFFQGAPIWAPIFQVPWNCLVSKLSPGLSSHPITLCWKVPKVPTRHRSLPCRWQKVPPWLENLGSDEAQRHDLEGKSGRIEKCLQVRDDYNTIFSHLSPALLPKENPMSFRTLNRSLAWPFGKRQPRCHIGHSYKSLCLSKWKHWNFSSRFDI